MVFQITWIRLIRSQVYKFNACVCDIRSPVALSWALLFRDLGAAPLLSIKIRFLDEVVQKRHYSTYLSKLSHKSYFIYIVIVGFTHPSACNTNKEAKARAAPSCRDNQTKDVFITRTQVTDCQNQ